jgi:hypothetical protein
MKTLTTYANFPESCWSFKPNSYRSQRFLKAVIAFTKESVKAVSNHMKAAGVDNFSKNSACSVPWFSETAAFLDYASSFRKNPQESVSFFTLAVL